MLDRDPAQVPDDIVRKFALEVWDHLEMDQDQYELAWRRLAYRVAQVLERDPDPGLTSGLVWARWPEWPEGERAALRGLLTEVIVRAAGDEESWPKLDDLFQAAAELDQDLTPWLHLVGSLPDAVVAHLAQYWSYDLYVSGYYGSRLYWENPGPYEQLRDWLITPALRDRLSGMDSGTAQRALEQIDWHLREISTR